MKHYSHLCYQERCIIRAYLQVGISQKETAEDLNRHPSTISREIWRNSGRRGYRPIQATIRYLERRKQSVRPSKFTQEMKNKIDARLAALHSPEQISGALALDGDSISHESIYRYIWNDKSKGGKLYKNLRHSKVKRRSRGKGKGRRGKIKNRVSIHDRPQEIERKVIAGHWEGDTVLGSGKNVLVTLVERVKKYTVVFKANDKTAESVNQAIQEHCKEYKHLFKSITLDNGLEFAQHERFGQFLNAGIYFADPGCSWQRGLNENTNGLLRQYLPKKTNFDKISNKRIREIQDELNDRPRKLLGFKTPTMVLGP